MVSLIIVIYVAVGVYGLDVEMDAMLYHKTARFLHEMSNDDGDSDNNTREIDVDCL